MVRHTETKAWGYGLLAGGGVGWVLSSVLGLVAGQAFGGVVGAVCAVAFGVGAVMLCVAWHRQEHANERIRGSFCGSCGYPLDPHMHRCPECGHERSRWDPGRTAD